MMNFRCFSEIRNEQHADTGQNCPRVLRRTAEFKQRLLGSAGMSGIKKASAFIRYLFATPSSKSQEALTHISYSRKWPELRIARLGRKHTPDPTQKTLKRWHRRVRVVTVIINQAKRIVASENIQVQALWIAQITVGHWVGLCGPIGRGPAAEG